MLLLSCLTIKKLDWILDFVLDFVVHFLQGWRKWTMNPWEPKWWTGQYHFHFHLHLQRADSEMVAQDVSDRQSHHHVDGEKEDQQGNEHIVLVCVGHRWKSLESLKFEWVVQSNQKHRSLDLSSEMTKILVEEAITIIAHNITSNCSNNETYLEEKGGSKRCENKMT